MKKKNYVLTLMLAVGLCVGCGKSGIAVSDQNTENIVSVENTGSETVNGSQGAETLGSKNKMGDADGWDDMIEIDFENDYTERKLKKNPWLMSPHQVYIANDIAYVVARNGDTFKDLGKEFDISWRKLVKYNDLQRDYTLMEGDIIYLKSKKKKASKPYTVYVVKDGDSMHGISQKYGIRLKNLYKMNRKDGENVPEIGDRLRLR